MEARTSGEVVKHSNDKYTFTPTLSYVYLLFPTDAHHSSVGRLGKNEHALLHSNGSCHSDGGGIPHKTIFVLLYLADKLVGIVDVGIILEV